MAPNRIGVIAVLAYVLSSVAPMLVTGGLIPVSYAITGIESIPFTLMVVAVLLGLFAIGYLSMAKHVSNAGAFYSYVARGLGRPPGIATAMVALGAYNLLQVGLYGLFGVSAAQMFATTLHVLWPWWAWALAAWSVVLVLGLSDVKWVGGLLGVFVIAEMVINLALSVDGLRHPAPHADYIVALSAHGLNWSTFSVAGAVAVLCFVGFEIAPVYRAEAKRATLTIILATVSGLGLMLLSYGLAAWAMIVHYGNGQVADTAGQFLQANNVQGMLFSMGSGWLASTASWLYLSSMFAGMMAYHNSVTRYAFVLGRERVLPRGFETINKAKAPVVASVMQSLIGFAVIGVYALAHWDPVVNLFFWLGQTGGFAVLALYVLASIAVVNFFRKDRDGMVKAYVSVWRRLFAPILSGVSLAVLLGLVWKNYSLLLGEQTPSAASRLLPLSVVALFIVGLLRAAALYLRHRDIYEEVGHRDSSSLTAPLEQTGSLPPYRSYAHEPGA